MRKLLLTISFMIALLIPLAALAASDSVTDPAVNQQLANVRQATTKYHDVSQALADSYFADDHCVPGMGFHYFNPERIFDMAIEPLKPEVLVYAPTASGPRLVAVEYIVENVGQAHPGEFGTLFDGPSPGPGGREFYTLHAWIWQSNPDGMFSPANRNIHCADEHE